jgi:hypothetical protein
LPIGPFHICVRPGIGRKRDPMAAFRDVIGVG